MVYDINILSIFSCTIINVHMKFGFFFFIINFIFILCDYHEGIKHLCLYCDYQSAQKRSLNRHIQAVHEGIKHLCLYCDYQATTKDSLKKHKSVHEGKNILVLIVITKQQRREVWRDIVFSFMQENDYSYICPFAICWVNSPPANEG